MKKSILAVFVSAAALTLSACGGGGDDDTQPVDPKVTPSVPNQANSSGNVNQPNQPANTGKQTTSAAGAAFFADRNDLTTARPIGVSGDRDSVISINGHNITVARPEFEDQNFGTTSDDGKTRTITNGRNIMSYVRFGFHTEFGGAGNDKQHYVFALGDPTPTDKMPTSGDTYYIGLSTFAMGTNPTFRTGLSSFHVDFDEKTIDGEVYGDSRVNPIELGGKINGNAFSGSKDGVEMQGHFYGPQAEQVGGIFKGTATDIPGIDEPTPVMGSFGARRL